MKDFRDKTADFLSILLDIQERLSKVEAKLNTIEAEIKNLKNGITGQKDYTDSVIEQMSRGMYRKIADIEDKISKIDERVRSLEEFRVSVTSTSRFIDKLIGFIIGVLSSTTAILMILRGG